MKVPMRKLSVLLYHQEKPLFLEKLRELGVVHVNEDPEASSKKLVALREAQRSTDRVIKALTVLAKEAKVEVTPADEGDPEQLVRRFESLDARREHIEQHQATYQKERATLEPWGNYDPEAASRLNKAGINLRFFTAPTKRFEKIDTTELHLEVINQIGTTVYFVIVERGEKVEIDAEEVLLPPRSLSEIDAELATLDKNAAENLQKRLDMVRYLPILQRYMRHSDAEASFEAAHLSAEEGADGRVISIVGWVPVDKMKAVEEFLGNFSLWYSFDHPEQGETVPIQLRNGNASSLFEPIINIYSLPDYFELDPTPFVAPFFAIFFGLSLGDLGYGLLLVTLSIVGHAILPKKLRPIMTLGLVLGICTSVAGIFLNSFFGHAIVPAPGMENAFLQGGGGVALLTPVQTDSGTYFPAMPFSIYLGIIQILVGMGLKTYNNMKYEGFVYGVQPFSTMLMVCGITILMARINFIDMGRLELGVVPVGSTIASAPDALMYGLLIAGLALLLLFNSPRQNVFLRPLIGLWELYNFATGLMSYSLSYLRLFALGLAGGLLGAAFNQIAFMVITTKDGTVNYGSWLIVFTILILVVGHSLNLALSALGAFVHPLRLTFVEFYGSMDFRGGGKPYKPLSKPI